MKYKVYLLLIITVFLINFSFAQEKKQSKKVILSALVIDTENNPIQNATIFVDGKKASVVTDAEGRFKLKLKRNTKSISIFTLFNGVAETTYSGQEELTFVLGPSTGVVNDPLNEATKEEYELVDVGYGKTKKRNLATSAGNVSKEHLKNARHYNSIYDMIKGEVPGVVVSGQSITIRGKSSINMSSEALLVVNGTATSSISDISPNDVKSISVLKGASAAIYGSRGANGVIIITLKTGKD